MLRAQRDDERCKELREQMDRDKQSRFSEIKGGLLVRVSLLDGAVQVYVPEVLRKDILRHEHDVSRAGHRGVNRMYASVRRHYYWEAMAADVAEYAQGCTFCARNRVTPRRRSRLMQFFPETEPFASVSLDILGPLTETKTGNRFLLIIVDGFSWLVRAIPMTCITATDISSSFSRDWITVYGPPDTALTDNGPQFASLFFQGVCGLMGIKNLYTKTYHPQTNGQVERFNKTLVHMFMHYIEDHQDNWDKLLSVLTLAYNSRPHRTTGVAPLDLVTPRRVKNFSLELLSQGVRKEKGQTVSET